MRLPFEMRPQEINIKDVDIIAVLGTRTMGHGIAEVAALAEYDIHFQDISETIVNDGYEQIEWSLEKLEEGGHINEGVTTAAADRVSTYIDLEPAIADADLIIEAFPEDTLKRRCSRP